MGVNSFGAEHAELGANLGEDVVFGEVGVEFSSGIDSPLEGEYVFKESPELCGGDGGQLLGLLFCILVQKAFVEDVTVEVGDLRERGQCLLVRRARGLLLGLEWRFRHRDSPDGLRF
jgi:hypothetical protein